MTDWKDILAGLNPSAGTPEAQDTAGTAADGATHDGIDGNSNGHRDREIEGKAPVLTLFYEKKGRAGKPATIITGFDGEDAEALRQADTLASTLKKRLGCGGSARGGEILLQGNRLTELRKILPALGYARIKG